MSAEAENGRQEDRDGADEEDEVEALRLRSGRSIVHSFVKFINQTQRQVDVVWLHFEGVQVHYHTLAPGQFLDVNTYQGHPWLFRDAATGDRMVVQSSHVFHPQGWTATEGWPPKRRRVHITLPVYTLQERCIQVIRECVVPEQAEELELPRLLIAKIKDSFRTQRSLPQPQPQPQRQ